MATEPPSDLMVTVPRSVLSFEPCAASDATEASAMAHVEMVMQHSCHKHANSGKLGQEWRQCLAKVEATPRCVDLYWTDESGSRGAGAEGARSVRPVPRPQEISREADLSLDLEAGRRRLYGDDEPEPRSAQVARRCGHDLAP